MWLTWRGHLGNGRAAWYGLFHAVSAFCNAGFDLFSGLARYPYGIPRDWERPFQKCADIGRTPRSLALYLLVDWSSSMRSSSPGVKLAMMALHVAAEQLRLPHAITLFGAGRDAAPHERLETIVSFNVTCTAAAGGSVRCTCRGEWPKALIAGYEPSAGNEYLFAGLDRAIADLQTRPERDKIILCAHDGQPVWSDREGRDWDLSIARVKTAEQRGSRVIGMFLGEDEEELRKMKLLFPRLIVTVPERLPEKLGSMLISLA